MQQALANKFMAKSIEVMNSCELCKEDTEFATTNTYDFPKNDPVYEFNSNYF